LKIDDAQLVRQCQQGDLNAFRELYELHKRRIYNIAYRIHGNHDDAQDAVQDAFVTIYKKINSYRGQAAFSTWIYRIVVNICLNKIRRSKISDRNWVELSEAENLADHARFDLNKPIELILEEEIKALPPGYRTVFVLREVEGFSHEEISRMLNISVGTSKSQLHRAKRLLQQRLKPFLEHL